MLPGNSYVIYRNSQAHLYLRPAAGAGKTILASVVVNHLTHICRDSGNAVVACVYFRYSERTSQSLAKLIAGIWRQMVDSHKPMSRRLRESHAKDLSPPLDVLIELLQAEAKSRSKVFIVLDALDECPTEKGTRSTLLNIIRALKPTPNILITSRVFNDDFLASQRVESLEIGARAEDMQKYITARIQREDRLKRHVARDHTLAELIVQELVDRAQKM